MRTSLSYNVDTDMQFGNESLWYNADITYSTDGDDVNIELVKINDVRRYSGEWKYFMDGEVEITNALRSAIEEDCYFRAKEYHQDETRGIDGL